MDSTAFSKVPSSQNVQVAVRVRNIPTWRGNTKPRTPVPGEPGAGGDPFSTVVAFPTPRDPAVGVSRSIQITDPDGRKGMKEFAYDCVYAMEDSQQFLYDKSARPIIERCLDGYNGCIFVYGQTASGKTYTMEGPKNASSKEKGIIFRVAEQIVQHIKAHGRKDASGAGVEFSVTASYLEIYQEQLKDLLCDTDEQAELRIRIDPNSITKRDLHVEGLTVRQLLNEQDFVKLIQTGTKHRTVAETNMNEVSSRSHAVLTITIEQYQRVPKSKDAPAVSEDDGTIADDDELGAKKRSKIHLIDLAGSERADATGATGTRLKEGSAINQSLSCLGNVINALTSKTSHVPYRDSKLTYLLSDSLGGNSLTLVIACLTPTASAYEETMSTLRFAERAKKVTNRARVNVDAATLKIMQLEAEVARLTAMLRRCTCGAAKGLKPARQSFATTISIFFKKLKPCFGACTSCLPSRSQVQPYVPPEPQPTPAKDKGKKKQSTQDEYSRDRTNTGASSSPKSKANGRITPAPEPGAGGTRRKPSSAGKPNNRQ